jgi:hypothetical protein
MPPNIEPTVAERLSYVDRLKAEARQFAAKIKHKNREYRRTRSEAAMMVAEAINAPYSEEKLRKSGCGYLRVDGAPRYRDPDLYALAEEILDRALKRGGASPLRGKPPSAAKYKIPSPPQALPVAVHRREAVGQQQETSEEVA